MNAETGRAAGRRDRPKRARTPRRASVETLPATWRTQAKALRRYGGETPAVAARKLRGRARDHAPGEGRDHPLADGGSQGERLLR